MTFQKKPKQKSNYPGMLENFEKKRFNPRVETRQKFKPASFNLRSNFASGSRKVPK
jgi:hypothetical protein